eukprot:CAMPEP_0117691816 /NCGR_PEP_ID=MMETSP0804-20121206/25956_1 /TAXON_ID=1074897 /ORGANISM="Tetraselmis astigmatica, Strain CCMP880" /LENGTH=84 /DNA_ID=CAMNT_0005505143 /DNA_START=342 /DNA_END=596 /DNA_ORIENTATION=+
MTVAQQGSRLRYLHMHRSWFGEKDQPDDTAQEEGDNAEAHRHDSNSGDALFYGIPHLDGKLRNVFQKGCGKRGKHNPLLREAVE